MPSLRFATDDDLVRIDPRVDALFPRLDSQTGERVRSWDPHHDFAMERIERKLRTARATDDTFMIGRIGLRSREHLRSPAAKFALAHMYRTGNTSQGQSLFVDEAMYWERQAVDEVQAESAALDYDSDGSDVIATGEQQRPMPQAFIRG